MDPLGAVPDVVDIARLKRWNQIAPRELANTGFFGVKSQQIKVHETTPFPISEEVNKKVALWVGDITCLNTHAIVNSTNETLTDKNPLSGRILSKSGPQLKHDLITEVKTCRTGEAKITKGYNLSARFVIHTVGPKYNIKYQTAAESALHSSYWRVLQIVRENNLPTVGLCAINSVRRGYPPHEGAHIALRTVRRFLEKFGTSVELIVFVCEDVDVGIYELLMPLYFPRTAQEEEYAEYYLPADIGGPTGEPVIPERQIRISDKPFTGGEIDDSVDLAAALESSVCVGKTPFARMHGDVDKKKVNNKAPNDVLTTEVQRKNRYERLLRKSKQEDLQYFAGLKCLYQSGHDRFGRPVFLFIGQRFKPNEVDLEKAILYLIQTLDPYVQNEFIVVYFHTMTAKDNHPPFAFLREVYDVLEYKYKKNLKALYIVHPTFWTRVMTWWFTTFSASGIRNKVQSIGGIEYLYFIIPPDQLDLPQFIIDYDYAVNGVRYCSVPVADTADSL